MTHTVKIKEESKKKNLFLKNLETGDYFTWTTHDTVFRKLVDSNEVVYFMNVESGKLHHASLTLLECRVILMCPVNEEIEFEKA